MGELGDAALLGHYVMVRDWAEKPETEALARSCRPTRRHRAPRARRRAQASQAGRRAAPRARADAGRDRRADPAWIEHPLYSAKQSTFPTATARCRWPSRADRTGTPIRRSRTTCSRTSRRLGRLGAADHDQVVLSCVPWSMRRRPARPRPTSRPPRTRSTIGSARCSSAAISRKRDRARQSVVRVSGQRHDAPAQVRADARQAGGHDKTARAACARVSELAPGDPSPHFAVGEALAKAGDLIGAHGELVQAARRSPTSTRVARRGTGSPRSSPRWTR